MKPVKTFIKRSLLISLSLLFITLVGVAQNYRISGTPLITIAGTSTIHDWTMTSNQATIQATFDLDVNGAPAKVSSLTVNIPAESLKSGKGAMDKNAYSSLKTDKNKQITFQLTTAVINGKTIDNTGNLTIAGTTKPIQVQTTFEIQGDGSLKFKGSKKIIMTEFNVEPPSFMFGSVKTGDEITLSFEITLSPTKL
jgi:polyisoprenoid-binding protein YceI